ncbi:hypothetical protein RJT34_20086 [Clitoria ternatea]|uniref:Uncharacterized protein n=1 Tax=Clitoria ternatea TaxID=43366 RepID=A0AAN9P5D7_CLITE
MILQLEVQNVLIQSMSYQISVGTLLAFTTVAISVLILRYIPPDEVPLPPSFQEPIDSVSTQYSWKTNGKQTKANVGGEWDGEGISKSSSGICIDVGGSVGSEWVTFCGEEWVA